MVQWNTDGQNSLPKKLLLELDYQRTLLVLIHFHAEIDVTIFSTEFISYNPVITNRDKSAINAKNHFGILIFLSTDNDRQKPDFFLFQCSSEWHSLKQSQNTTKKFATI